jgi:hypothetical protein
MQSWMEPKRRRRWSEWANLARRPAHYAPVFSYGVHTMGKYIWYSPLDGHGALAVNLFECRWFNVQSYHPEDGADYGLDFYMCRDGRWIQCTEDEDYIGDDAKGPKFIVTKSYREVHPISVAHGLLSRRYARIPLPPELERYREFGDPQKYSRWLWDQSEDGGGANSAIARPKWDDESLSLSVDGLVCRTFKRRTNNNQIHILASFESLGWPEFIPDPFRNETKLKDTVKDFNGGCKQGPFRLRRDKLLVGWKFRRINLVP